MGLNKRKHDEIYPELIKIFDGEYYNHCGLTKDQLIKSGRTEPVLLIDHRDNNSENNRWSNLQLLCRSCNVIKGSKIEPYKRTPTPEMERGTRNMKRCRRYVVGRMLDPNEHGALEYETLVDDIAEKLDCSQQSIKNYLAKLTSAKHGSYTWEERPDGKTYLVPKTDDEYFKNLD